MVHAHTIPGSQVLRAGMEPPDDSSAQRVSSPCSRFRGDGASAAGRRGARVEHSGERPPRLRRRLPRWPLLLPRSRPRCSRAPRRYPRAAHSATHAQIRLEEPASYLQAVLEISRPSGQLLFKRTRVANDVKPSVVRFPFERQLTDVLHWHPAATRSASPSAQTSEAPPSRRRRPGRCGSTRRTGHASRLARRPSHRIPPVVSRWPIRNRPGALGRCTQRCQPDQPTRSAPTPNARVTLAVAASSCSPSGAGSPAATRCPTAPRYGPTTPCRSRTTRPWPICEPRSTRSVSSSSRSGYADPNLTDLANQGLAKDVGPQYDAGISAVYQSLEVTPSTGTVTAGGCVPPNEVGILAEKGVRYVVVDTDCAREGKSSHPTAASTRRAREAARTRQRRAASRRSCRQATRPGPSRPRSTVSRAPPSGRS